MREVHARSRTAAAAAAATSLAAMDGAVDLARDRELVEACQAGDQTAFAELYSRYHRRLMRFCVRRLHTADDAEEAVQEAFTRAWRALPRFGGDRRFYPWLTVIAGNVCTDMLRRRSRVVPLDDMPSRGADGAAEADVDERLLRQVDLAMASEALGHLSDRHQRVLRLREATEWTSQRIAEHEGVAVPAVDTLLWRARQAFKREFAALSDAGGLAAALGVGMVAMRRVLGRIGARMAALGAAPTRSPGALVATVAVTGAAVAGGGIALIGATSHPAATAPAAVSSARVATAASPGGATGGATRASGADGSGRAGDRHGTSSSAGSTGDRTGSTVGAAAASATTGSGSGPAGSVTTRSLGGAGALGGLGTAASAAGQSLGHVVSLGVGTVTGIVGLHTGTPPASTTTGSGTGSSVTTGTTSLPVTPGSVAGTVGTTVSGATGSVTTTLGTATGGLLGTST